MFNQVQDPNLDVHLYSTPSLILHSNHYESAYSILSYLTLRYLDWWRGQNDVRVGDDGEHLTARNVSTKNGDESSQIADNHVSQGTVDLRLPVGIVAM